MNSSQLEPVSSQPPSPAAPRRASIVRPDAEPIDTFDMWFAMDFRRILRRRWPLVVVPALLLAAAAGAYTLHKKPMYSATATVLLQSRQTNSSSAAAAALAGGLLPASLMSAYSTDGDDLNTQGQIILSDHILNDVAHTLHLRDTPAMLRGIISVDGDKFSPNILDITVRNRYPVLAKRIADTLVQVYQNNLADESATVLGSNAKVVREQTASAQKNLKNAEDALVAYSGRSGSLDADADASKRVESQYQLQTEYNDARQNLASVNAERSYLVAESTKLPAFIVPNLSIERNPRIESDKATLAQLESERARLGTQYTAKDPEMVANQNAIETVQKHMVAEREDETASLNSGMAGSVSGKVDPGYVISGVTRQVNPEAQALQQQLVQDQAKSEAQTATVAAIKNAIQTQKSSNVGVPEVNRRLADLKDTVALDSRLYDDLRTQYQTLEAQRGNDQVYARVLEPAMMPRPIGWMHNLLLVLAAAVIGLFGGALAMLGVEAADKRVRGPLDIQVDIGLPVLAAVPELGLALPLLGSSQRLFDAAQSPVSVRRLASSLAFMGLGSRIKSLLVTSALPDEGVTFIASQLAIELAKQGQRVVVVDANLRSPSLHSFFGLENTAGLAAAMRNGGHPETSLVPLGASGPLQIVSSGELDKEAATQVLNNSAKLNTLLSTLLEKADVVLIDTPAVLDGVESALLAGVADATVLVASQDYADREDVRRAAALLASAQAPLLGVVLNEGVPRRSRKSSAEA